MTALLAALLIGPRPKPLADLPFVHGLGRIWLKAHLNDRPCLAMLDTGAQWSVADADEALAAGAKKEHEGYSVHGVGANSADAWGPSGLRLTVDGLDAEEDVPVATSLASMQRSGESTVAVLLGGDLLRRFVVEVDYANSRVRFYDPRDDVLRDETTLPLRFVEGRPVATISLTLPGAKAGAATALVDTGATGVTLTGSFSRRERLLRRYPDAAPYDRGGGVGGAETGRLLPDVQGALASASFSGPVLVDTQKAGAAGPAAKYDLILGDFLFADRLVTFDYGRAKMAVGPRSAP